MCTGKPKTLVSNLSEALHDVQQSCMSSGSPTYLTSFHLFSQIYHTVSYQKCQILQSWIIAILKYLCQYEQKCYLFFLIQISVFLVRMNILKYVYWLFVNCFLMSFAIFLLGCILLFSDIFYTLRVLSVIYIINLFSMSSCTI